MSEEAKKNIVRLVPFDAFQTAIMDELWLQRTADWMRLTDEGMDSREAWELASDWMMERFTERTGGFA